MNATDPNSPPSAEPFLPTRSSLLSQLRDPADREAWGTFVQDYERLIYQVCLRTGLTHHEAEEVWQETLIAVSRQMPQFQYDRSKGPFKGWLARVARNLIADYLTKKTREAQKRSAAAAEAMEPDGDLMAAAWESQWQEHLLQRAMSRAQEKVSLRNLQIFQMATVHGWSAEEISAALGVNRAQIYVAKHRVGRLVAKEIRALRSELE